MHTDILLHSTHRLDATKLDKGCTCKVCKNFEQAICLLHKSTTPDGRQALLKMLHLSMLRFSLNGFKLAVPSVPLKYYKNTVVSVVYYLHNWQCGLAVSIGNGNWQCELESEWGA